MKTFSYKITVQFLKIILNKSQFRNKTNTLSDIPVGPTVLLYLPNLKTIRRLYSVTVLNPVRIIIKKAIRTITKTIPRAIIPTSI